MKTPPTTGSYVTSRTVTPTNGIFHIGGLIRRPEQLVSIAWEVDNSSGSTECEAWRGQYEIDCLIKAGYKINSVTPH